MNPIIAGAAIVTAITSIAGAGVYLDHAHVASEDFQRHLSEQRVRTIFSYMDQIAVQGPEPWLCRALHEEFLNLCTELPEHAMCDDKDAILHKINCQ